MDYTLDFGKNLPSRARRLVKANNVIISSVEGSLDKVALITQEFDNAVCSTGFYVLDSDKVNFETLLILFKLNNIKELMKQRCSETILTAIKKEDIKTIPIPKIDNTVQQSIKQKIKKSFKLKQQSKELLDITKKTIEIAIE